SQRGSRVVAATRRSGNSTNFSKTGSMKLPRWLLISLIAASAVALLAVPVWLWVEMPRWTAEKFVAAIAAGDAETANRMLDNAKVEFRANRVPEFIWEYPGGARSVAYGETWKLRVGCRGFGDTFGGVLPIEYYDQWDPGQDRPSVQRA